MNKYLKNVSVLYVEDEKEVRDILERILSRRVKNLYIAENGKDGLEKFRKFKPDIIVTDIMMPKMNGLDMIREIREEDKEIPIIITSAFNDNEYFVKAIDLRVAGFILKPVNMEKLFDTLNYYAKMIVLEKEKEMDYRIIQAILDKQDTLLSVVKNRRIIFANKRFKEFFNLEKVDLEIKEVFTKRSSLFENCEFEECVSSYVNREKEVMDIGDKSFLVDITKLDKDEYLFSFTDVTNLTEKTKEFERLSLYDDLTGVYNKRAFNNILASEIIKPQNLSVIMFDIDHFKQINDTYGHLIGDTILKELSNLIKEHIRENDILARWGGEEFMILLPNTTKEKAYKVAEKLREVVENHHFKDVDKVTCSFGVNQLDFEKEKEAFVLDVDKALYRAKFSGRNRVEMF